jgi:fatty acid-binding protein DegV
VYIAHGDCVDDANILAEKLKTQLSVKEVVIDKLEAVIGTHTGAGAIAIFFLGESRKTN